MDSSTKFDDCKTFEEFKSLQLEFNKNVLIAINRNQRVKKYALTIHDTEEEGEKIDELNKIIEEATKKMASMFSDLKHTKLEAQNKTDQV